MSGMTLVELRDQVWGDTVAPGDDGYDEARAVHNGMIDRRPAVVVRAANAGDVMASVHYARENGLALSLRGGGHSAPGFGTNDDGVVIDFSGMRGVRVDPQPGPPEPKLARPGATSTPRRMRSASRPPAGSSPRPASAA